MGGANPISTITGQTSAGQYGFTDPFGLTPQLQNTIYGTGGALSGGPMGLYNQNSNAVLGQIAGLSGPLQQTLSGIANYQANNALNAVGSNFANVGALGSGAAAQAFGQALANPFAQAQAQLQSGQLQAGSGALNSLMGLSGQTYGQGLNAASSLMEHGSGLVAPTNYTNPAFTSQQQGKGALTGLGTAALGNSGLTSAAGNALGGLGKGGGTAAAAGAMPGAAAAGKGLGDALGAAATYAPFLLV